MKIINVKLINIKMKIMIHPKKLSHMKQSVHQHDSIKRRKKIPLKIIETVPEGKKMFHMGNVNMSAKPRGLSGSSSSHQ